MHVRDGPERVNDAAHHIAGVDQRLDKGEREVDKDREYEKARQQDARGVQAAEAVAPHDPVRGPDRHQRQRRVDDYLDLGFERLDGRVGSEITSRFEIGCLQDESKPDVEDQPHAVLQHRPDNEVWVSERKKDVGDPCDLNDEALELRQYLSRIHQWLPGTDLVRMSTSEPATSTPMVPTTMRWIHCLAASADFDSAAVIFQRNAKMKARAPIDATKAWPM